MAEGFLDSRPGQQWTSDRVGADFQFFQGEGNSALEVVVATTNSKPTKDFLQGAYTDRRGGRVNPIIVVAVYGDSVGLCGPSGEEPPVYRDVDRDQAERVCAAALEKPNRHVAQEFLTETLPQLDEELAGLRNQGLLSTNELRVGVPKRDDWPDATSSARRALTEDPRELLGRMNYEIERLPGQAHVLKDAHDAHERAVAVFLQEDESFDHVHERFVGQSPVAYALTQAEKRNIEYVIGSAGDSLRLYTTNPDAGFGSRGRTDTYVEINTSLLAEEKAGYLWLLFSANALRDDGSLQQIMERSKDYAARLGARLRERIYDDVVPDLAEAIAQARDLDDPTKDELDETYRMALVLLYRLLFISYAEDEEFLPRRRNAQYDQHSLKRKARDLHQFIQEDGTFDPAFSNHWEDVMFLTDAIHSGHDELGLPEYDGRLLSDESEAGEKLAELQLDNEQFGPVLVNLLIDETEEGYQGPVDFRNIGVREFGVIYEGLLESELSVADQPLGTDSEGHYEPVDPGESPDREIVVSEGQVYLHGQSGERKATGTYYTKTRFVEHLLDYSLEPALDDHIDRINRLREEEGENAAANAFFDLRVADIAMGSGHFLVGAVDRIESRLYSYLTENPLAPVEQELDNLKNAAEDAFEDEEYGPNIERGQLLRRQVARRCIYGVDLNPLATELARLSIWVHTFVPGLPLTFLDYNLVTGDSLAGIGTLDEVTDILDVDQTSLGMFAGGASVMNEVREDIARLGNFADASAEQVREARETRAEIEQRLKQVEARFDILAASRVDDEISTAAVSDTSIDDVTQLSSYERAQEVLESTNPLHFPAAFPEVFDGDNSGFDVIIGNPPWEKTQIERHEFWARHHPGLRGLPQGEREDIISELEDERPDLLHEFNKQKLFEEQRGKLLTNGPFPDIGKTHPDLYKAFVWRFWSLNSTGGYTGVVLPRATFITPSMEKYRKKVLSDGTFIDLTFVVNNRHWVFSEVHPQFTIALASIQKSQPEANATIPLRGPYPNEESFEEGVYSEPHRFDLESAESWGGSAKFPLLPASPISVSTFNRIDEAKRLSSESSWYAVPYQELNATQDKKTDDGMTVFHTTENPPEDGFWPIYKGESYDIWEPDRGIYYGWANPDVVTEYLHEARASSYQYAGSRSPFSDMTEDWIENKETLPCLSARISFRDVSRHTDSRTIRAALIPPETPVVHNSPTLIWPRGERSDEAYLLGVLCSIPLDWYSRRFVENHVTFGVFNNLPIPRPGRENPLRKRVVELAGSLAAVDDRYDDWADAVGVDYGRLDEEDKQEKIYELDAVVAHLYGLTREHVEVIFETFHEGWDYEERLERVLEYYTECADRLDLDHADSDAEGTAESEDDD